MSRHVRNTPTRRGGRGKARRAGVATCAGPPVSLTANSGIRVLWRGTPGVHGQAIVQQMTFSRRRGKCCEPKIGNKVGMVISSLPFLTFS
jgi:hypothetical protein